MQKKDKCIKIYVIITKGAFLMYGYETFHDDIIKELVKNVHNGQNRQAYLFVGPDGVGKHEAANLFAASLACSNTEIAPCGKCQACIGAKSRTNPDIVYIEPTDKKVISAEQARSIVTDAYIKPFESKKKIYIINDGSKLNEFSQNCLLKILEEPPEYVVFIIIATSETVLLQTVLSRCTLVRFPIVNKDALKEFIKSNYPEYIEQSDLLYSLSSGSPGNIRTIIENPDYEDLRKESFKMLVPLMSRHKISAYTICDFIESNADNAELIIDFWQSYLRDIMLIQNGNSKLIINIDMQEDLQNLANKMKDSFPIIALEQTVLAKMMLKRYVNLHNLALSLSFSIKKRLYN